jgi:hypothetical protein
MSLAPIALFVYNRPKHTLKTLDALAQNDLASQSELFVFCDGPKHNADIKTKKAIEKVRAIVRQKQWCNEVTIYESDFNKGLADSIVTGVTQIVNKFGKIIVLEDDIVTAKGFLSFMNNALELYKHEDRVMQISGFMVPSNTELAETGFFRQAASWGWATWSTAWKHYNNKTDVLLKHFKETDIFQFNIENTYHHFEELLKNDKGSMKTWLIRWYASMYINKGLCLYPKKALVNNLGFGSLATHTKSSKTANIIFTRNNFVSKIDLDHKIEIKESTDYLKVFKDFYVYQNYVWGKPTLKQRIIGKLKSTQKKYF